MPKNRNNFYQQVDIPTSTALNPGMKIMSEQNSDNKPSKEEATEQAANNYDEY